MLPGSVKLVVVLRPHMLIDQIDSCCHAGSSVNTSSIIFSRGFRVVLILSPRGSGCYWLLGGSPLLIYFV
jgi:hypothetical protein